MNKIFEIAGYLKWPFALGMLAYLGIQYQTEFMKLLSSEKNWGFLLLGFVLCGVCAVLTFVRWYLLVWAQEFDFTLKEAIRLGGFGMLCNYGGPGIVGGDIIKAAIVAKKQKSRRTVAAATVVLDRILGLLALFWVGAISTLIVDLNDPAFAKAKASGSDWLSQVPLMDVVWWGLWGGSLGGLLGVCIMLYPGSAEWRFHQWMARLPVVGKIFADLLNGIALYQTKRRVVVLALAISLVGHTGLVAGFWCCALSLQTTIPSLWQHYFFMPAAELVASIIPMPGGIGPLEGAISLFYQLSLGGIISSETAAATGFGAALAFRVVTVALSILGATYYLMTKQDLDAKLTEEDAVANPPEEKQPVEVTT